MIGRIYKIVHTQSNICYVGMTTTTLKQRWFCHKSDYNKDNKSCASIYKYMREYGIEQFRIMLIKEYDVIDKNHLKVYETLWMKKLHSINEVQSFNSFAKSNYAMKEYYQKNKEKIIQNVHNYASKNKEKIKERGILYREKNKEKLQIRRKEYQDKNRILINCECGSSIYKYKLNDHLKTKKHMNYTKNN